MPASLIHLVRHGEVHNPDGVLYGRIEGFHLSERGHAMADAAAASLSGRPITALYASPLQRTQESAAPLAERFGLEVTTDERLIEPWNNFEGGLLTFGAALLKQPRMWPWLLNPVKPSWGEPYVVVATRMIAAIDAASRAAEGGEAVIVSHQLPIVMVQRAVARKRLFHDPRARRCALSSITTLEPVARVRRGEPRYRQVDYREPAAELLEDAIDTGAV